jgi:hypothetical protein
MMQQCGADISPAFSALEGLCFSALRRRADETITFWPPSGACFVDIHKKNNKKVKPPNSSSRSPSATPPTLLVMVSGPSVLHSTYLSNNKTPVDKFKGTRGSFERRCGLCLVHQAKLLKCTACQVVRYCSKDHQVQHRKKHKSACNKIKKCRIKVETEDYAVRNATADFMTPANAFDTHVGHFWGIINTRDYMRARFALIDEVHRAEPGSLEAIAEAADSVRDLLRLCRGDNMGVRDLLPPLLLQLDQDQECYDFCQVVSD